MAEVSGGRMDHIRIALGSVAPLPLRCPKTEAALFNQRLGDDAIADAMKVLAAEISPIDDLRSTKNYRLQVSLNLLKDFLSKLQQ